MEDDENNDDDDDGELEEKWSFISLGKCLTLRTLFDSDMAFIGFNKIKSFS